MILCHVHIPRTGGTTLADIQRRSFGVRHCDVLLWPSHVRGQWFSARDLARLRLIYPKLDSVRSHNIAPFSDLDYKSDVRYYTFLREPIKRCLSNYGRPEPGKPSLVKWLEDPKHRNRQTQHLAGTQNADAAIRILEERIGFVGLTERYDETLVLFKHWAQHPRLDIRYGRPRNAHTTESSGEQGFTDSATLDAVKEANTEDIKLYRYVTQTLYPRQQEAYDGDLAADVEEFRRTNLDPGKPLRYRLGKWKRNLLFKALRPLICTGIPQTQLGLPLPSTT